MAMVASSIGCATAAGEADLRARVDVLRQEQQQRQAQLYALAQEEALARRQLEIDRCRAQVASIQANVAIANATCLDQRSGFAECLAKNEAHTSKGGMWGALGGLALSFVTGGAAAPLVAAGMGAGLAAGGATTNECGPAPQCTSDKQSLLAQELAKSGWATLPTCQ